MRQRALPLPSRNRIAVNCPAVSTDADGPPPPERRRGLTGSRRATIPMGYPISRSKSFASEPKRLCVSAWSAKSLMT